MDPVVHFEMPYKDRERAESFYSKVFGWQFNFLGEAMNNYTVVTTAEEDARPEMPRGVISGGLFPYEADAPGQLPSVVVSVKDINQSMEKIRTNGGKIHGEPVDIPDVGRYVKITDTEGNELSILQG